MQKRDFMLKRTRLGLLALAVWVIISCTGCGTIITRFVSPNWSPPDPTLPRIYSGTLFDFRCFLRPEMHETQGIGGFCLVDVPFSLIADTVILPLTIYEQVKYGSYAAGKPTEDKKQTGKTPAEKTTGAGLITKESASSQSDKEFTAKTQ
jgi:uncharacterized protein YceK